MLQGLSSMISKACTDVLAIVAFTMTAGVAHTQTAVEFKSDQHRGRLLGGRRLRHLCPRSGSPHRPTPPRASRASSSQNMPGASSLKAVQYLDTGAPKDGSVITAFNPGLLNESLLNADKIRFKFTDVAFVGSITRDLRACYAWAATGIKTFDDLKKVKQFNMGAPAPGTSSYINEAVLKNMFGIAVRHVTGYAGSAQQRLAIERGELDGDCGAWSSVTPDWVGQRQDQSADHLHAAADPEAAAWRAVCRRSGARARRPRTCWAS